MDLADASQIWLGHETGSREIMTIDVKDFARYRLPDGDALEVLWAAPTGLNIPGTQLHLFNKPAPRRPGRSG